MMKRWISMLLALMLLMLGMVDADERLPGHSTVNRLRRFCTCHLCNIERVLKQPPPLLRIHLPHKLYCAPDQLVLPSVIRRILRAK